MDMYREGNEASVVPEVLKSRDVEWFKGRLLEQKVSMFEIVWGNYIQYFHEVPSHLMDRYLHHRSTFLHRQALSLALYEEKLMEEHPFAS